MIRPTFTTPVVQAFQSFSRGMHAAQQVKESKRTVLFCFEKDLGDAEVQDIHVRESKPAQSNGPLTTVNGQCHGTVTL